MPKAARPQRDERTLAVRIKKTLYADVEAAAVHAERTLSDQVRIMLQEGLARESSPTASPTAAGVLPQQIAALAAEIEVYYGDWRENAFAWEAFMAGLKIILSTCPRPEGKAVPIDNSLGMWLFGDEPDPQDVGRTQAAVALSKVVDPKKNAPPRGQRGV